MANNYGDYSFGLNNVNDYFKFLIEDYNDYLRDPLSVRYAITSAIKIWQMAEWVYKERELNNPLFSTLEDYQNYIKSQCPELHIIQDIANGSKHCFFKLNYNNNYKIVVETTFYEGPYDSTYDSAYDTSSLEGKLIDGTVFYFEDVIEKAMLYWSTYLNIPLQ